MRPRSIVSSPALPPTAPGGGHALAWFSAQDLGSLFERFEVLDEISYTNVGGMAAGAVPGHAGRFVRLKIGSVETIIARAAGSISDEGHSARRSAAQVSGPWPASGRDHPPYQCRRCNQPGFLLSVGWRSRIISNPTSTSPLTGSSRFCDMGEAYDPMLRALLLEVRSRTGHPLHPKESTRGCPAPNIETPAEVRMLAILGADAVGMSTVLETIQARALWMKSDRFVLFDPDCGGGTFPRRSSWIMKTYMARGKAAVSQLERILVALHWALAAGKGVAKPEWYGPTNLPGESVLIDS